MIRVLESRDYDLYHATSVNALVSIINSNKLLAASKYVIDTNNILYGISLTRDIEFSKSWYRSDAIIVFDANKLSHNYKLIPRGATSPLFKVMNSKNGKAEEFLVIGNSQSSEINDIKRYIKKILVRDDIDKKYDLVSKLKAEGLEAETY